MIKVSAAEAIEGFDLGIVNVSPRSDSGTLVLNGANAQAYQAAVEPRSGDGVLLVSIDGQDLYPLPESVVIPNPSGDLVLVSPRTTFPAGQFYVLPGMAWPSAQHLSIVESLRLGADLSSAGIPMVSVVAGNETIEVYDVMAAYAAIHQLRMPTP